MSTSSYVAPASRSLQNPPNGSVEPVAVAGLGWDTPARQFLRDSVVGPTVGAQSLRDADDFLLAGMWCQHLARRVGRVEDEAVRNRAGAFTPSDLLLQDFMHTFCDLFPLQLGDVEDLGIELLKEVIVVLQLPELPDAIQSPPGPARDQHQMLLAHLVTRTMHLPKPIRQG